MRFKASQNKNNETCAENEYCVSQYSRRASLVKEFCLDMQEHNIPDLETAERPSQQTLRPRDFA
jgi:hypothetical protein